jgi:hypothetical protein
MVVNLQAGLPEEVHVEPLVNVGCGVMLLLSHAGNSTVEAARS